MWNSVAAQTSGQRQKSTVIPLSVDLTCLCIRKEKEKSFLLRLPVEYADRHQKEAVASDVSCLCTTSMLKLPKEREIGTRIKPAKEAVLPENGCLFDSEYLSKRCQ